MTDFSYPFNELLLLFAVSAAAKVLLIPAYFSTDFDVHQNWLRITYTQPMRLWYYDTASEWTLDYPPLFAYFEWLLAYASQLISPSIAQTINQSQTTILYQRATVILSQLPFLLVLYHIIGKINHSLIIAYLSIPFILLDNIHFQYNIIMQAIFLLSVHFIQQEKFLRGAFLYSCLLNFKHIYLYASLAFLAYILKMYVLKGDSSQTRLMRLAKVGTVTLLPFVAAFLPFLLSGGLQQLFQILSRLFPFQRGLIHQYWAPNFWALYHFSDKLINLLFSRFFASSSISFRQISSDLHQLKVLPDVSPLFTTLLVLIFTAPVLIKFFNHNISFSKLVFLCGSLFFLFGFHVHQKAITPYVGLMLVFTAKKEEKQSLFLGSAVFVNIISLLPLLIEPNQKLLRLLLPFLWIAAWEYKYELGSYLQSIIFGVGITVTFYHQLAHPLIQSNRLAFLPLMLNSVFAAAFNLCWVAVLYSRQLAQKQQQWRQLPTNEQ